jgi:ribulose 1,5-bisphosphate synthetase/thiazole synthase
MRVMQRSEIDGTANDTPVDVAIVGAGPYGLSIAAHLRAAGVPPYEAPAATRLAVSSNRNPYGQGGKGASQSYPCRVKFRSAR